MDFELRYCKSIDHACITLHRDKLNIVLAPNGTGKSTIAKAITLGCSSTQDDLKELLPFKLRESNPSNLAPSITCSEAISATMVFDEGYTERIVFQREELVANSFDVFIRSQRYRELEEEISRMLGDIKSKVADSQELRQLKTDLTELAQSFKPSKTGIAKNSSGIKGLARGNMIQHIPPGLESFASFIQSTDCLSWLDWQIKGYSFLDLSDQCPFCVSDAGNRKQDIKRVGEEYNKAAIKNLLDFLAVVNRLGDYLSDETKGRLSDIGRLSTGLEAEHEAFLISAVREINLFIEKLTVIENLSALDFKDRDSDQVSVKLPTFKLDLRFFSAIDSEKTRLAVDAINASIDQIVQQAGVLQGKINIQRREATRLVADHEKSINEFLEFAGYNYRVQVVGEDINAKMKLKHLDYSSHLEGGKQYLSFGERNAFAVVLFMYECLSRNPQVIILDDPISSFDKNKKYSILEMLFRRNANACLKSRTVLLLTHDVEPVIDTMKAVYKQFENQTSASYLSRQGNSLVQMPIERGDILTFGEICRAIHLSDVDLLIKLIYLRRSLEISDEMGDAYQVLSNLFHKRQHPIDSRQPQLANGDYPDMSQQDLQNGCDKIKDLIPEFVYSDSLVRVSSSGHIRQLYWQSSNGYEKLQLFRLLELDPGSSVIRKYMNETYHVENEYISQLNPAKFDLVPDYIINICDGIVEEV